MRSALIIILALILSLGVFSYFAEVRYVSQNGSLSIGRIGVQFIREGQLYRMPPPPYRNQIASIVSTLSWFKGSGSPVGPTYTLSATATTNYPHQDKLIYAKGLFWWFYYDGTYFDFITSQDGVSWSSPAQLSSTAPDSGTVGARGLSVYYDEASGKFYYALAKGGTSNRIYYRWGTLNQDGTITWDIDEGSFLATYDGRFPYIRAIGGTVWVSVEVIGTYSLVELWKYDGSWTKVRTVLKNVGIVLPLSDGSIALLYDYNLDAKLEVSSDGGATWSTAVVADNLGLKDATAVGNVIHAVGIYAGDVKYARYDSGAWSSVTTLLAGDYESATITADSQGNLYVFAVDNVNNLLKMLKSTDGGNTWSESEPFGTTFDYPRYITSSYYGDKVLVAWSELTSASQAKFGYVPVAPQVTYFQVGVSDISVNGKYVKATPNSALNTANITVRVYHNVDNNSTWVLAGQYPLANEVSLPWSGNTTSPWYELLSGSYAQGNHTYYMKVEILVEGYDAMTGQQISKSAYAVLSTSLYWQSMAPEFENLQLIETDMVEKVYVPIVVTLINSIIMGTAIYLSRRQRD